ncbi:MAG: hypothetical protein ACLQPD_20555 [Desulfomonilaceae bacterium]
MPDTVKTSKELQSQFTDEFFYFFLRVRKERVRKVVQRLKTQHPDESPEQLARRLISSRSTLSFLGGGILHLPMLLPGIGQAWKLVGFVGGTSVLSRMHLYLILEIALLFGKDIDDQARVSEMIAVVTAVGVAASMPFLLRFLELNPLYAIPSAALSAVTVTQLVGESAIRHYKEAVEVARDTAAIEPGSF